MRKPLRRHRGVPKAARRPRGSTLPPNATLLRAKRLAGKPHEPFERADGGRATARPPPTLHSGTGSEQKAPDRRRTSGDAGRIQKVDRRGKAPCCVAVSTRDARVSTWRKCGQVRNAKAPAPASRSPESRPETPGVHPPPQRDPSPSKAACGKTARAV